MLNYKQSGVYMKSNNISPSVIKRLPRYYRFIGDLKAAGKIRISSGELAKRMNVTASQIRQDLNCFGDFGQQGYGYNIELLHEQIAHILGIDTKKKAIIIGLGNLGKAVALHINFESLGFRLIGAFDRKEALTGQIIRNIPIRNTSNIDEFCRENFPEAAFLCVPKEAAEAISEQLISLGVKAFWNFSHFDLQTKHPEVVVENMHFGDSLMQLSYHLTHKE